MLDASTVLASARRELTALPVILGPLLDGLDSVAWRQRPAPAEWSPIEIVCHLRDEETEDFGARVRVVVAGGDHFAPIDPERWVHERQYREADPTAALAEFRDRRAANLTFLAATPPDRLHAVVHSKAGALSGLDLLAAWVTHDRLHLAQVAGTLARLGAERWAPLRADYAGPIPYAPRPLQ